MPEATIPTVVLGNATKIPVLGLASWGWSESAPDSITQSVKDAIDLGYRFFDTTPGKNEEEIGEAIFAKIKEGVVKREEIYLIGKLGDSKAFHKPELIKEALMTTLRHLNVAYLDMYVIDCPEGNSMFSSDAFVDTWYEMEKLVDNFLVKSIGVSNFNEELIKHLMNSARFAPAVNQLECPPSYTQRSIRDYCREKRIFITGYNITASSSLIEDPVILDLAKKYSKTAEQILLRYQIDMGHIALSQLQTKMQMKNNLEIFKFELSKGDLLAMEKLDRRTKIYT
ncbi:aldo-keto reductase family 1 member B1-like [Bradysia coprophila]|uniref:aldo-keto reductase family 1 member B1-like n=1 Tax=Bradysia coprophila TaxID=38358 RepID=UPI00187DCCD8|nr:aldo-keto reductase family 1 member B1-like [Bradysia coprophila]